MKKFFTLIAVLSTTFSLFAQTDETYRKGNNYLGRLSVSTFANYPVRISIDGNIYNGKLSNDGLMVNDIKAGYHSIKVYRQRKLRYANGNWNNKTNQLIYEGNIYVKPQYHVDITINRFGKAFTDEQRMDAGYYDETDNNGHEGWGDDNNYNQQMNSRSFDQFKQVIRNESFDNTRLTLAKQTIASNYFSAAQVKELVGLFSFENSKLDIAKYSYKYTLDKNNYFVLNDAFSYSSSKEELARYIQSYR